MIAKFKGLLSSASRFLKDGGGGPAAEFALTLPILAGVMIATLQVGVIFVAKAYLESGAEEGARLVLTNNATTTTNGVTAPMTQAQFQAAICADLPALFTCSNLIVQLQTLPCNASASTNGCTPPSMSSLLPTFNSDGTLANSTSYTTGSSGTLMVLSVMYEWPVYGGVLGLNWGTMGNGSLLMTSTQVFKVEA